MGDHDRENHPDAPDPFDKINNPWTGTQYDDGKEEGDD